MSFLINVSVRVTGVSVWWRAEYLNGRGWWSGLVVMFFGDESAGGELLTMK
jgi:hypothetical protein